MAKEDGGKRGMGVCNLGGKGCQRAVDPWSK
jgi:hypothetical protein